jgi:peptide deformylase
MIREIIELGNPLLRNLAIEVRDPGTPDLGQLVEDLLDTMNASDGVGIAAPQIGVCERVIVVASRPDDRYPGAPLMEPVVMINPRLEWGSAVMEKDWEGCLSIPGIFALVPRAKEIRVRYVDFHSAKEVVKEFKGFFARVWLHENDHLDGIVFPDRIESSMDLVTDKEYRRILSLQMRAAEQTAEPDERP